MAVDADLDQEGKPSLEPDVDPAQLWVDEVEVEMKASSPARYEAGLLGPWSSADMKGPAVLGHAKDGHQALCDAVPTRDLSAHSSLRT